MDYRSTAIEAVDEARRALRDVMAEAVAAEAFGELPDIARAAEALAAIAAELRGDRYAQTSPAPSVIRERASVLSMPAPGASKEIPSGARRAAYPQYFRDGDRLV